MTCLTLLLSYLPPTPGTPAGEHSRVYAPCHCGSIAPIVSSEASPIGGYGLGGRDLPIGSDHRMVGFRCSGTRPFADTAELIGHPGRRPAPARSWPRQCPRQPGLWRRRSSIWRHIRPGEPRGHGLGRQSTPRHAVSAPDLAGEHLHHVRPVLLERILTRSPGPLHHTLGGQRASMVIGEPV